MEFEKAIYLKKGIYQNNRAIFIIDTNYIKDLTEQRSSLFTDRLLSVIMETLEATKINNKNDVIIYFNVSNISNIKYKKKYVINLIRLLTNLFPYCLYKLYIINTSKLFNRLYNLIIPFIHKETRARIEIINKDYKTISI